MGQHQQGSPTSHDPDPPGSSAVIIVISSMPGRGDASVLSSIAHPLFDFWPLRPVLHDSPVDIGIDGLFDRGAHVIDKVAHFFFNVLPSDTFLLGRDHTFFRAKARF